MFDSHLHLTSEQFSGDVDEVIRRARAAGVSRMVTISTDPHDGREVLALVRRYPDVLFGTAGLHPHDASAWSEEAEAEIRALLQEPEIVAVGEAGLDFHYDHSPRAIQREAFEAQLDLAAAHDLPIIVHSRDADETMLEVLLDRGNDVRGVLHCFTGGDALLEAGLDAGWYVSFGGITTFNSFDAEDRVRRVPHERLMIETDSPYLAPVPERGKRNEPSFLPHVCSRVAGLRGVSPEELAAQTTATALRFYGIEFPLEAGDAP